MEKARRSVGGFFRTVHDIRINIYQKHTKCDGYQQKGLKALADCQIQENARNQYHQVVTPCQVKECRLMDQIRQCISYI